MEAQRCNHCAAETYEKWDKTKNDRYDRYDEVGGAGKESAKYETDRLLDLQNYLNKEGLKEDEEYNSNKSIIHKKK